jgi:putative NADH-flavin reductase
VIAADVTLPGDVARLAGEHDAVIAAVYDGGADPADFFVNAARALSEGAGKARLVWVGLASIVEAEPGVLLMDTPGYPQEYRALYLAHEAAAEIFAESALDWVSIAPAGDFDHDHPVRTGGYQVIQADSASRISYADLAIALLDEIDDPRHHRTRIGVARTRST